MSRIFLRALHAPATAPVLPIPRLAPEISNPTALLTLAKRNMQQYASKFPPTNEELFAMRNENLKELGLPVRDRRYLMWFLQKIRAGEDPASIGVDLPPKKKFRGWGAKLQNGLRK